MTKDSRRSSVSTPAGDSGPGLGVPLSVPRGAGRGRLDTLQGQAGSNPAGDPGSPRADHGRSESVRPDAAGTLSVADDSAEFYEGTLGDGLDDPVATADQDRPPNFRSDDGRLYLVRCFECAPEHGRENWAMNVASGTCAWCGWQDGKTVAK